MLTTVVSHSRRARRTRLRWPSWRAPIVGTSPTGRGAAADHARTSRTAASTTGGSAAIARALPRAIARVRVLRGRELASRDLGGERPHRRDRLLAQVRVPLHELRRPPRRQPE